MTHSGLNLTLDLKRQPTEQLSCRVTRTFEHSLFMDLFAKICPLTLLDTLGRFSVCVFGHHWTIVWHLNLSAG